MIQIKQIRQLKKDNVPIMEIARRTGLSRNTVKKYLRKLGALDTEDSTSQMNKISDKEIAAIVYNNDVAAGPTDERYLKLLTHFKYVKGELPKTGANRQLLWHEYQLENSDGYKYSQYCNLLKDYLKDTNPAYHLEYQPGEFTQIDFAGKKMYYTVGNAEAKISCEIFVASLPFSGLIFCMAVATQRTADFAHCIVEMVKYFGGLTLTILSDNLKTAVIRADKAEPVFTQLCHQLSEHYETTFSATAPRSPTHKAMVEGSVNIAYNHIYGPLRNSKFTSLEELNKQIRKQLDLLNLKPYKGARESRRDLFNQYEKSTLKPLPERPFELMYIKEVTVQRNYYVILPDNKHYYSVPYQYVGKKLTVHYNPRIVELYYKFERVAFHVRRSTEPVYNRIAGHMPENHKAMEATKGWNEREFMQRAAKVGKYTEQTAHRILHSSIYMEQNFKACNTMLLLQNKYTKERLEECCKRASNIQRPTLRLIRDMLENNMDKQPTLFDDEEIALPAHQNIRGSEAYK
ncbi:MAG TPA: IS21 family transposase [Arachidicoccus sp.]|nr:IS21 family transposase [Arachidicoccus sp.]